MHLFHLNEFKNSIVVAIRLLHLQPFTKSHFHFFILMESETSQVLFYVIPIPTPAMCYHLLKNKMLD
jgi:hypothetical protein